MEHFAGHSESLHCAIMNRKGERHLSVSQQILILYTNPSFTEGSTCIIIPLFIPLATEDE